MPARLLLTCCALIACTVARIDCFAAEQPSVPASPPAQDSVQKQLDELKAGQQRLFMEMEAIKKILEERTPRTNFASQGATPNVTSANVAGEPFRGTNSAKLAIIEYSDFDCSFCGRYARNVFPKIDGDYVKTGKVRYFFRDLPEPNETNAWFKARVARCAGDQGKFWEMHDLLFATQSATPHDVVALASTLGLNAAVLDQCLSTEKYLINIQRSAAGAKRMGLYGTPAFLIGTLSDDGDFVRVKKVLVGAEHYEEIKNALDELLASAASK